MKRILWSSILICLMTTGCKENDCWVEIDPAPNPVSIILMDTEGNNLLDAEFPGNILSNNIVLRDRQHEYPLKLSEWDYNAEPGLYKGKIGTDKIPGIQFWYVYISTNKDMREFTIDWGDDTSDKVGFQFYYTVVKCDPVGHRKIYLNGQKHSDNSLTVTVVK